MAKELPVTQTPKTGGTNGGLTNQELRRYSRHLLIPEFGREGQERLKQSSVLIVGAGGLGSPASMYLAAAGVGRIGLVDFDTIDDTNLQRQLLYSSDQVGQKKLVKAKERLNGINPNVTIETHATQLTSENALAIIDQYDLVIDGTDNFPTRYLVNDACVMLGKPNVYGSIFRFEGQVSVFGTEDGPCYRCLYPDPPPPGLVPSCAEGGVLGVLPGIVGSLQANEAIKTLAGIGDTLAGRLLLFDALHMEFTEVKVRKNEACVVCGPEPTVTELIDYEEFCGVSPAQEQEAEPMTANGIITATQVKNLLDKDTDFVLLDVRELPETQICQIPESTHIPMGQVPQRLDELPKDKQIVCYCRTGGRSGQVAQFLRGKGYDDVQNLTGGIHAWIDDVDPDLPKY